MTNHDIKLERMSQSVTWTAVRVDFANDTLVLVLGHALVLEQEQERAGQCV